MFLQFYNQFIQNFIVYNYRIYVSLQLWLYIILNILRMENKLKSSGHWSTNSFYTTKSGGITTVAQSSEEEDIKR